MILEEFNRLVENNQPHPVFNSDWGSFDSSDFAANLLPTISPYKAEVVCFYNGAELFSGLSKLEEKLFYFDDDEKPFSIITYSYSKGVLAEKRKERFVPTANEVAIFIEVGKDGSLELYFKFGRRFKRYLDDYFKVANNVEKL